MALLVTLFLVLVNIFNAITNNSPKADGLNALQVSKKLPIFTPKILWKWKSEKFILVLFDDTSSFSKFMNENEENKKKL